MRIGIFGVGYVGLVTAACLAEKGNHVIACDINKGKIERLKAGETTIHEKGLDEILRNLPKDNEVPNLEFTTDNSKTVRESEVLVCTVGTPFENRFMNLEHVWSVMENIERNLDVPGKIIAVKSTVPVGTNKQISEYFLEKGKEVSVVSNPEFLVEGNAVDDTKKPSRIIIGSNKINEDKKTFDELYSPFLVKKGGKVLYMRPESAELSKLAANAFLALRISFINEIANFAEISGADIDEVRLGIGSDERIGMHYLYAGQGYGGSCFPKDLRTLIAQIKKEGLDCSVLEGAFQRNEAQKHIVSEKVIKRFADDRNLNGKSFALWGLTFKAGTDDMRESPSLTAITRLTGAGAIIKAYDPDGNDNARRELESLIKNGRLEICDLPYEAINGADALIICTEWDYFKSPDFDRIRNKLKKPIIFDGRNLYEVDKMEMRGFEYYSIGRRQVTQR